MIQSNCIAKLGISLGLAGLKIQCHNHHISFNSEIGRRNPNKRRTVNLRNVDDVRYDTIGTPFSMVGLGRETLVSAGPFCRFSTPALRLPPTSRNVAQAKLHKRGHHVY